MLRTYIGRLFIVVDVVDVPGQPKVSDLHDVALGDQNVPGCQVSMYTLGWREWEKKQNEGSRGRTGMSHRVEKAKGGDG